MQINRILAVTLILVCLLAALVGGSRTLKASPASPLAGGGLGRIAVVKVEGAIGQESSGFVSAGSLETRLLKLAKASDVKGVLLQINSPGGRVGTSQEIYRAILAIKAAQKPVVATMGDIAASGGYYIASAADKIFANPGSLTGSIGVILQGLSFGELLEEYGIQPQTFKTGAYKDILSPYRLSTPAEKELLQALIEDTLDQFVEDVSQGRQQIPSQADILSEEMLTLRQQMTPSRVRELADGRVFTGRQAVTVGLVDAIGSYPEALADLRRLLKDDQEMLSVGEEGAGVESVIRRLLLSQLSGSAGLGSPWAGGLWQEGRPEVSLLWLAPAWLTH
ncbi:MAG: signal peptide peptidase SppA [Cyanobacteriota bacterium]|nr:signal peptide peptidase SppA [Cyanobacteriota bacterium]